MKRLVPLVVAVVLFSVFLLPSSWGEEKEDRIQLNFENCTPVDKICDRVRCAPLLKCEGNDRYVHEKGSRCRCCPICVKILKENDICIDEPVPEEGPEHLTKCSPELECVNGICVSAQKLTQCIQDFLHREKVQKTGFDPLNPPIDPKIMKPSKDLWKPKCDLKEGNFEIKQCQSKRCFCVEEKSGERIFGQEESELSANMTCKCASTLHKRLEFLREENRSSEWNTYEQEHCTPSGDYQDLQCYKDTCFCVDPKDGTPLGTMVKIKQRHLLPCFESKLHKDSYLTRCEKQMITERKLIYDFSQKGITILGLVHVDCDFDGWFKRVICTSEECYCATRAGTSFKTYKKDRAGAGYDSRMQCRCSRDEEDNLINHKRYESLSCDGTGNYNPHQCFGDKCFCADNNGDRLTEPVDVKVHTVLVNMNLKDLCTQIHQMVDPLFTPMIQEATTTMSPNS